MHKLIFTGFISQEPVKRYTQKGDAVLDLNFRTSDWNGKERVTIWIKGSLWGKRIESLEQYLAKGTPVAVEGKLLHQEGNPRVYTTNAGETRASFEIIIVDIDPFIGGKQQENAPANNEDVPW